MQTKIPVATQTWRSWCEQGSLLSIWQQAWPITRVLSQHFPCSVRPLSSTSSSTASWLPVSLAGVGLTSPRHQPKGQWNCCQLGQHFTAEHHSPNKQCSGPQATGNMEPVITSRAWLVHSPKTKPGQELERELHLTQISQPGYVIKESFSELLYHYYITVSRLIYLLWIWNMKSRQNVKAMALSLDT